MIFDQQRFVTTLEKMPRSLVSLCIPVRISAQPVLHSRCQIRLGRANKQMDMIRHPAIREHFPCGTRNLICKPCCESLIMSFVVKDLPSAITSCNDVVDRAGKLQSWRSWHLRNLNLSFLKVIPRVYKIENRKPSLTPNLIQRSTCRRFFPRRLTEQRHSTERRRETHGCRISDRVAASRAPSTL